MKHFEAKRHLNNCEANPVHQPPPYLPPRGEGELVHRELVSNPPTRRGDRSSGPKRLIVHHHNGRQLVSRMVSAYKTIADWRREVADLSGSSVQNIKIYRFGHMELTDQNSIQGTCYSQGATWLTSFDITHPDFRDFRDLADTSAFLTLYEPGQRPVVRRPPEPPQEPEPWPEVEVQEQEEWW